MTGREGNGGPGHGERTAWRLNLTPTESQGHFVRETDAMRTERPFRLLGVTVDSVRFVTAHPLESGERIDLVLANPLQRVQVKTRGEVTRVARQPDGGIVADAALRVRLTPLMVSLLKMGIARAADGRKQS